ncbi:MAG: FG-GAP repeat protein [Bacteroidia bacterium]|nr:FG-GAP repeat protein [Bacteroidia bacterium]
MGIDVGNTATPQLVDINRDGLHDLLIGEKSATINYFKNIGTAASAFYSNLPDNDTLGGILLQSQGYVEGYTVPFFYDTAGTRRLAVSNMGGNVYFYDNIDGNLNGTFRLLDSLYNKPESSRIKFNVSVNGGDINGDGFVDLVLGQASGGLQLWYQYNPTAGVPALEEPAVSFIAFPNPARDEVRVSFNHLSGKGTEQLEVTDIAGRVLYRSRVNAEQMVISTTEWASGLYLLRLVSETASRSMKLRVQH